MAKTKKYLQNGYSIILRLIAEGEIECLPVYTPLAGVGEDPTVVLVFSPTRHRMPYLRVTKARLKKDGTLAKRRKRADNRSTLSAGPWISMHVVIGKESPLQEILARSDPKELRRNFIVVEDGVPKVKIFMLVKDLSAAARQTEHIFAKFSLESDELISRKIALEAQMRGSDWDSLDPFEQLQIRVDHAALNLRLAQIRTIGADRAARDFALHFVIREAFSRLQQYSKGLRDRSMEISRQSGSYRTRGLLDYLTGMDQDLSFFSSKEIVRLRGAARAQIHTILADKRGNLRKGHVATYLFSASKSLEKAAGRLADWDHSLPIGEVEDARRMRQLATQRQTLL